MPCLHPWKKPYGDYGKYIEIPCGRCVNCRIDRTREWTQRLLHERIYSDSAVFLTLTYDDEHLPFDPDTGAPTVLKADIQRFNDRLRYRYHDKLGEKDIRFFCSSEYGSDGRPHYHGIWFNLPVDIENPLPGSSFYTITGKNNSISKVNREINKIWKNGFVTIGDFTRERAGYVAKYFVDKLEVPEGQNPNFSLMSRNPGIGFSYCSDVADKVRSYGIHATMTDNGKYLKLPRYYDKKIFSDEERKERIETNSDKLLYNTDRPRYTTLEAIHRDEVARHNRTWKNQPHKQI